MWSRLPWTVIGLRGCERQGCSQSCRVVVLCIGLLSVGSVDVRTGDDVDKDSALERDSPEG